VVAANGTFLERRTPMFATSTRLVGEVPGLAEHASYCHLACGRINRVMHGAMLAFFQHAHRLHGGEAALLLLYNVARRFFRWYCPEQTVDVYVSDDRCWPSDLIEFHHPHMLPDGYVIFGDAHLHPGAAYPSVVDMLDDQDGLHIIVGNIDRTPRYHVDFVMDGARFAVPENVIFDEPDCEPWSRPPKSWLDRIHVVAKRSAWSTSRPTNDQGGLA
jgi:hypothetical protein